MLTVLLNGLPIQHKVFDADESLYMNYLSSSFPLVGSCNDFYASINKIHTLIEDNTIYSLETIMCMPIA